MEILSPGASTAKAFMQDVASRNSIVCIPTPNIRHVALIELPSTNALTIRLFLVIERRFMMSLVYVTAHV